MWLCRTVCTVMSPKDADRMANSLIWVCTVCPDLSVRKLGIITVYTVMKKKKTVRQNMDKVEGKNHRVKMFAVYFTKAIKLTM